MFHECIRAIVSLSVCSLSSSLCVNSRAAGFKIYEMLKNAVELFIEWLERFTKKVAFS